MCTYYYIVIARIFDRARKHTHYIVADKTSTGKEVLGVTDAESGEAGRLKLLAEPEGGLCRASGTCGTALAYFVGEEGEAFVEFFVPDHIVR